MYGDYLLNLCSIWLMGTKTDVPSLPLKVSACISPDRTAVHLNQMDLRRTYFYFALQFLSCLLQNYVIVKFIKLPDTTPFRLKTADTTLPHHTTFVNREKYKV